ncbi:Na+/H+ antiporter subunit A [Actinomadura algeriensis]|uniref:Multicomponent Na+:H+ antiporter subunit A n=1 Tax=Actinomadura algeriensis TaxID=1679523 RepID=A0ABR9JTI5_9ACTN|nr:Na+/H+ antiporter subunit A [Actinomadura algeriensis]MBE1533891.1 multicomponent Na+:H+ antiporter subunit A [Actinomadura algeriensis]
MFTLILLYAAAAVLVPWALGRHGRAMGYAAALVPAATAAWAVARAGHVAGGRDDTARLEWAPRLGLAIDFRLDALAVVMLLLVGGVGAVVLCYAARYFPSGPRTERLAVGTLVAFAGAMTGLVLADNLLVLYVFWELTTVSSFILIGAGHPERVEDRRAALQALLTTTAFGLVMLAGFIVLGETAGTYRISELVADPPGGAAARTAMVLILLGAFAKSAQMPLHAWLPAAMVAPTPVSGYLHAAAMVKAGVYLVARLSPAFAESGPWSPLIVSVGLVSLLAGGVVALRQDDLKRLLAYGTVSQLGFLMVLFGAGTRTAALAGIALLLAHGLFKAPLFLAVGVLEHREGTRHADELSGAGRRRPVLAAAAALAIASMIGLPPFLGFVAKETALKAFAHGGTDAAVLAGIVAGSALTVAYGARFLHGAFGGPPGASGAGGRPRTSWGLVAPVVVLAVAGFAGGMLTGPLDTLLGAYADTLPAPHPDYEFALWHGLGLPIYLTIVAFAVGFAVYWAFGRTFPAPPVRWRPPDAQDAYDGVVAATLFAARGVTRRIQTGSLPAYLTVIGVMVLLLPGAGLAAGLIGGTAPRPSGERLRGWDEPGQLLLVGIVVVCAAAAVRVRRRLSAALLLAGVGYAVGGLFVVHGGPDVALTLLVVETLSLIMLVLALRRLPDRFPPRRRTPAARAGTAALSIGLGVFVALFMVVASISRTAAPVGPAYAGPTAEEGAKNVVNMIIVDLRALDTLGEIVVLAVASMGVAGLVLTGPGAPPLHERRPVRPGPTRGLAGEPSASREPAPRRRQGRTRWLAAPGRPPLGGSSVVLEATARLLGPTLLVVSIYLLVAGHGRPGGGFVGGLVAGMAFVLRYLPGGKRELALAIPVRPAVLLGGGLLVTLATGAAGWLMGDAFLYATSYHWHAPVIGEIHLPTSLFFDVGVYLLVLGLVLTILTTLGASLEEGAEQTRAEREGRDVAGEEPR